MSNLKQIIRNWLDITEPKGYDKAFDRAVEGYRSTAKRLEDEMWKHRTILKKKHSEACSVCKKRITLWPLESQAYYVRDGQVFHTECYDKRASGIKE